jgi:hypothetical protein
VYNELAALAVDAVEIVDNSDLRTNQDMDSNSKKILKYDI